jgi:hypothetical protein
MTKPPRPALRLALLALASGTLLTTGCVGGSTAAPETPAAKRMAAQKSRAIPDPADQPTTGLETLATDSANSLASSPAAARIAPEDLERRIAEQARLIEELQRDKATLATARANPAPTPQPTHQPTHQAFPQPAPPAAPIAPANTGLAALSGDATNAAPLPANQGVGDPVTLSAAPAPTPELANLAPLNAPLADRLNQAADELAKSLRERSLTSATPAADYAALAWLDTIRPGVLGSLETPPASRFLDPRQIKSINVTRDMLARVVADPALLADPDRLWRAYSDAATPITQARDVRIAAAELCTKVEGFGQYTPVASRNLLAGVSHALIVYAEVDSFTHRRFVESDSERFTVELGHAVEIWQDADRPTLQRRWNETVVKDVSRRQRRDFYIAAVVELPANLSVGAYNLKLIVKDRLRNAVAERTLPFTIIADGTLASGRD